MKDCTILDTTTLDYFIHQTIEIILKTIFLKKWRYLRYDKS